MEDLEEAPENEVAATEEAILDQATAARSIAELQAEIETLQRPGSRWRSASGGAATDTKWRELASLLGEIFTPAAIADRLAEQRAEYDTRQDVQDLQEGTSHVSRSILSILSSLPSLPLARSS